LEGQGVGIGYRYEFQIGNSMTAQDSTGLLANAILILHVCFVGFVLLGLVFVILGGFRGWRWVRNPWFRLVHLLAIGVVAGQAWCGAICPLTTWEMSLRERAGQAVYEGSFMAHWLQRLLYYDAPPWVFVLGYTLFGLAVAASWFAVRPRSFFSRTAE
jgi:polyferredoxin